MPNWYQKTKSPETIKSRYRADIEAYIWVPTMDDKEKEKEIATIVLDKNLIDGDASANTGIESNLKFNILSNELV
jgi:hypothetical protein